jgi:ribosomal protein L29
MAETRSIDKNKVVEETEVETKVKAKSKKVKAKVKEKAKVDTSSMSHSELVAELKKTRKALVLGEDKDVSKLRKLRKQIARLLTIENQKNHE